MNKKTNKKWVIIVAVIIAGIFTIMLFSFSQRTEDSKLGESVSDIIDRASEGANELGEEIKDEIDDNTDSK